MKSYREEVLTVILSRSPVAVEILSSGGEQSQFFETAVESRECGMLFRLPKLLKEF
jgi:hypothetical protein